MFWNLFSPLRRREEKVDLLRERPWSAEPTQVLTRAVIPQRLHTPADVMSPGESRCTGSTKTFEDLVVVINQPSTPRPLQFLL